MEYPRLLLVKPAAPASAPLPAAEAPAPAATAPRVLAGELARRLRHVNGVCRRLRDWGIGIAGVDLRRDAAKSLPHVLIRRDPAVSIAPLLDAAPEAVTWIPSTGPRPPRGLTVIDHVLIEWDEPI
ncbi:MAG: hypothetical protein LBE85_14230 [Candidatus Accumulibacter sp.]|jgi:hypothetical protein|nr:hypothetical protein [Accumulibacter sp.]